MPEKLMERSRPSRSFWVSGSKLEKSRFGDLPSKTSRRIGRSPGLTAPESDTS